jgi:hypothetical protein
MNNLFNRWVNQSDIDRIIRWHTRYGPLLMGGGLVTLAILAAWWPLTSQMVLGSILSGLMFAGRLIFVVLAVLSVLLGLYSLVPLSLDVTLTLIPLIQYGALVLITFYLGIRPVRRQRR